MFWLIGDSVGDVARGAGMGAGSFRGWVGWAHLPSRGGWEVAQLLDLIALTIITLLDDGLMYCVWVVCSIVYGWIIVGT